MIQKAYSFTITDDLDLARSELAKILREIREHALYAKASSIYVRLNTLKLPSELTERIVAKIRTEIPKAQIAGMSLSTFTLSPDAPITVQLNCVFFLSSAVKIIEYEGFPYCYKTVGKELGKEIAATPDVKAVEVICAGVEAEMALFMENVSAANGMVPFFGALAGRFFMEEIKGKWHNIMGNYKEDVCRYAIGRKLHEVGIVLVVFAGADLHIKADYILGWKPLGKEMTITDAPSTTCIACLDDMPATQIYRHYLKVEPDAHFLQNVCEFPLIVERNGCFMARVPPIYDEHERLYFNGDFKPREKVRLSYANSQEMLAGTRHQAEAMRQFAPEASFLTVCGNRDYFLKSEAHQEIDAYKSFAPELMVSKGEAEIYRQRGQGGVLNSALIAVGMREGEGKFPSETAQAEAPHDGFKPHSIPLSTRMAAFLDATTRELKTAVSDAKQASRAKSQFLSNMSHEIRTPINAILGMNEMILRECTDKTICEYAQNIANAGASLLGLVNDILDFSKIEAGKMDIIPVEYSLSSLLNDLVNMVQQRAGKRGLELVVKVNPKIPGTLYGDEIRVKQIATNILTNAVKYTEKGGITLEMDFAPSSDDDILLIVKVTDTGIGIKAEDIDKLFSAFERIEEKRNRTIEGTGLGMNITQKLLSLMGSKLEVDSVYGQGSTFAFRILQKVVNAEPIGNFEENYRRSLAQHKAYREKFIAPAAQILVVDDTVMNLTVVKGLLKQTQIQIDTAESGYEALKMSADKKYDVIFLDHRMPGMDGIETLAKLKAATDNPNAVTPVISLTANAVSGARAEYMAAGFDDYLTKPINSDKLENMLMKYLPPEKLQKAPEEPTSTTTEANAEEIEQSKILPAWLNNLGFLDTAAGVHFCGSPEGYLDALIIFAEAAAAGADEIEGYCQNRALEDYTVKVHALKSSARIIGAEELSERAKRLEEAGNSAYWDEIETDTPALLALYREVGEKLAPLWRTMPEGDKPAISADELAEAYDSMRDMAASFDYDNLNFILRDLGAYEIPTEERKRYEQLKKAAGKPDWEAVNRLLNVQ